MLPTLQVSGGLWAVSAHCGTRAAAGRPPAMSWPPSALPPQPELWDVEFGCRPFPRNERLSSHSWKPDLSSWNPPADASRFQWQWQILTLNSWGMEAQVEKEAAVGGLRLSSDVMRHGISCNCGRRSWSVKSLSTYRAAVDLLSLFISGSALAEYHHCSPGRISVPWASS